jgi:hypothetical protein
MAPAAGNRVPWNSIDFTLMTKGVDSSTGKRYVLLAANPAIGIYSVDFAAGVLRFEHRGPELGRGKQNNGDGVCDPDEVCLQASHSDVFADASGVQHYLVLEEASTPCGRFLTTYAIGKGLAMVRPESEGGGRRRITMLHECGVDAKWSGQHVGCAKTAVACAISSSGPGPARDPKDTASPLQRGPYSSEVLVVFGNGAEVRRLAMTRSVSFVGNEYWSTPRAAMSPDGSRILFASNFGRPDRQLSVLLNTSGGSGAVQEPTSQALTAFTTGTLSQISRIYLQNQTTNAVSVWFMGGFNGAELLSSPVVQTPVPGWRLVARGDFDKNGTTDLVLQNQNTFQLSFWYMTAPDQTTLSSGPVVASPAAGWDVVAAADFDVNGTPDLILQNRTTHALSIWYLSGANGTVLLNAPVFGYPIGGWRVVGTGDFDRNGLPDIVFQNQSSYAISVWYMGNAGSMVPKAAPVIGTAAAGWRVRGVSDFNRDGWADIVLQNEATNAVSVWYMTGPTGAQIASAPVIAAPAGNWSISVVQ